MEREKGRVEAFSDGVFAIVITLLVLDLRVPAHETGHLWSALVKEWPQYVAFVISFGVVGIIWMNHHSLFSLLRAVDRPVMMANLFVLFTTALIPFPTAMLAEVINDGGRDAQVAGALYAGSFELMAIAMAMMFWVIHRSGGHVLRHRPERGEVVRAFLRFGVGHIPYVTAIVLAFVNPLISVGITALIALYYSFEQVRTPMPTE